MDVCVDCGMRAVGQCQACQRLFCGQHLTRVGRGFNEYEMRDRLVDPRLTLPREPRDDEVVDWVAANRIMLSDGRALCLYHRSALIFLDERSVYLPLPAPNLPETLGEPLAVFLLQRVHLEAWNRCIDRQPAPGARSIDTAAQRKANGAERDRLAALGEEQLRSAEPGRVAELIAANGLRFGQRTSSFKLGLLSSVQGWITPGYFGVSTDAQWLAPVSFRSSGPPPGGGAYGETWGGGEAGRSASKWRYATLDTATIYEAFALPRSA